MVPYPAAAGSNSQRNSAVNQPLQQISNPRHGLQFRVENLNKQRFGLPLDLCHRGVKSVIVNHDLQTH